MSLARAEARATATLSLVALGMGLGLAADALRRAALQARFPYDLNFWSEDYFMTAMRRLAAGAPSYGPLGEASSSIYAPGGPWLHHALLSPLELSRSVSANRWLSQLGVLAAVALGVRVVDRLAAPERFRAGVALLAAAALILAAYANPVIVSLHPVAWELPLLAGAMLALTRWQERSTRVRILAAIALPALGFLVKQSAGVALALALALTLVFDRRGRRAALALVPVASLGATALALHVGSGGRFTEWGIALLAAQGFEGGSKWVDDFLGFGLWYLPALVGATLLLRREWLRVALVPLCYAPLSALAFAKTLGGPNNVAALGFVVAIVGVAGLAAAALEHPGRARGVAAAALLGAHVLLLHPRRHVPTASDYENAERICAFARARAACGERPLLGRGTSCNLDVRDRMVAVHDVFAAGRARELDLWQRIERGEYDLVLVHHTDLHRFGELLWPKLAAHYRAFHTTPHEEPGQFWKRGWQGYASRRMIFFEKQSAAGEHRVGPGQERCGR